MTMAGVAPVVVAVGSSGWQWWLWVAVVTLGGTGWHWVAVGDVSPGSSLVLALAALERNQTRLQQRGGWHRAPVPTPVPHHVPISPMSPLANVTLVSPWLPASPRVPMSSVSLMSPMSLMSPTSPMSLCPHVPDAPDVPNVPVSLQAWRRPSSWRSCRPIRAPRAWKVGHGDTRGTWKDMGGHLGPNGDHGGTWGHAESRGHSGHMAGGTWRSKRDMGDV